MALEGERQFSKNAEPIGVDPKTIRVEDEYAFYSIRNAAIDRGKSIGMGERDIAEIDIVIRELLNNIISHGGKTGHVTISHLTEHSSSSLVLDVVDHGPGFKDFDNALLDGVSGTGSMGGGLPSVRRFAERVELVRSGPAGSHLRVVKRAAFTTEQENNWVFALFTRPHPGESECGDAGTMIRQDDTILLVLADGLGHGPKAAEASRKAVEVANNNHRLPLPDLVKVLHSELARTRGSALSLARIYPEHSRIDWLGLGNVSGSLFRPGVDSSESHQVFANYNGTIGVQLGAYRTIQYTYQKGDWLVLSTDGLTQRWQDVFYSSPTRTPHTIGREVLRVSSRKNDDSAILIGRSR
ncbi:SpoIIE family protein phosphatase [bacterium]|nr:SpoIIE family protein phosphatase [bacterium]